MNEWKNFDSISKLISAHLISHHSKQTTTESPKEIENEKDIFSLHVPICLYMCECLYAICMVEKCLHCVLTFSIGQRAPSDVCDFSCGINK